MGVRLQFEGIRCFYQAQDVVIRPITLLVGENSSGKTTFLALCRIVQSMIEGPLNSLPFNESPFWLGAYDQIVSRRRGRSGGAGSFSVGVSVDTSDLPASLSTEFVSESGQPSPHNLRLRARDLAISATNSGVTNTWSLALERNGRNRGTSVTSPGFDAVQRLSLPHWHLWKRAGDLSSALGLSEDDRLSLNTAFTSISLQFQRHPVAFAPIRTNPRRTYDPVSAESEPEGSHVPMLMAVLARSAEARNWKALQSALSEFGSGSGLFDGIEIVNKGKKASDPFQIGVKSGGTAFNLIDVGYGVSQALPILVDTIQRSSDSECFLLQQPEVHLHPRAQAELGSFFARQAEGMRRFIIETHSDHLVDRIRMEVRRKHLKPEQVSLLYFERDKHGATIYNLELDKNGSIVDPPPGYRQFFLNEERDLLGI